MSQFALSLNQFPDSGDADSLFPRSAVSGPAAPAAIPAATSLYPSGTGMDDRQGTRNPYAASSPTQLQPATPPREPAPSAPMTPASDQDIGQHALSTFPRSYDRQRTNQIQSSAGRYGGPTTSWTG